MSVSRFALRILTRILLKGQTVAEDRVEDSAITNLEAALKDAPKPILLVFTDDSEFKPQRREVWGGQGNTSLVLIMAIAGAYTIKVTDPDGNETEQTEFAFPATGPSIEMGLDMMERQIQMALMDPDNPWAILWKKIVGNVNKWKSQRGGSDKEGVRFAARQIVMECETVEDPVMGSDPEGVWKELVDALEASPSPDIRGLADPLRAMIRGKPLPEWKREMAELGINFDTAKKIGLGILSKEGQQPVSRITIFPDGLSSDDPGAGE